jgi:hypothetical protein
VILVAAQVLWMFRNSGFRRSFIMATSAWPVLLWHYYVSLHLTASPLQTQDLFPFSGLFLRFPLPNYYSLPSPIAIAATLLLDAWADSYAFGRTLSPLLPPASTIAMVTPSILLVHAAEIYRATGH